MHINIIEDDLLAGIVHDFADCYPFLKLCFYGGAGKKRQGDSNLQELPASTAIEDCALFHGQSSVDISPARLAVVVERDFMRQVGLLARIFRRAGPDQWTRIDHTELHTLAEENLRGGDAMRGAPGRMEDRKTLS